MDDIDNISSEIQNNNQSINDDSKLNNAETTLSSFESTNRDLNENSQNRESNNDSNAFIDIEDSKVLSNNNSQEFNADGEEVHTVKFIVTIVAAFPAGKFKFQI